MRLFLIGALFLFFACKGQKKTAMQNEKELTSGLQLIVSDDYSGADVSETLVIMSENELKSFYSQVNSTRKPGLPIPEIDFKKEIIVITCSGERNDGSLPILEVKEETDSQMVLSTASKSNKKQTSQAITSPFSIYKMPLTDKEIIFEESKQ